MFRLIGTMASKISLLREEPFNYESCSIRKECRSLFES